MTKTYLLKPVPTATFKIDYAANLNPQQLEAVRWIDGPALTLAGAGSGKTRTITYRTAYLIESGIAPGNILLLTFTNKAAREMVSRVETLLGTALPGGMYAGTFHHVGNRLLRRYAPTLGYDPRFSIIDPEDAEDLMDICIGACGLKSKAPRHEGRRFPKAGTLIGVHSYALNTGRALPDCVLEKYPSYQHEIDSITQVLKSYESRKKQLNLMDYDDLLINWLRLLREQSEVADALRQNFRYLMVDEYQDTNTLQGEIIDRLSCGTHGSETANLMVVGDDAQSIYAFRGANYENILRFPERYPNCQVFKLESNYRSSPQICALASASIAQNERQFQKELLAIRPVGELPALVPTPNPRVQAEFVAQRVLELRDEGVALNEMACLYRSHYQSLELQLELTRRGIPFVIRSGLRFFEQAHVKDILAFLRAIYNPHDEIAWKRLLRLLPAIGAQSADKIWQCLQTQGSSAEIVFKSPALTSLLRRPTQARSLGLLQDLFSALARLGLEQCPARHLDLIYDDFYRRYVESHFDNPRERCEDLIQLTVFSRQYPDVGTFLAELSLLGELGGEELQAENPADKEQLVLSTIHRAKGLEWQAVFLLWAAENHFPSVPSLQDPARLEEERRLFYVAVTRAKDWLHLTYPIVNDTRAGASGQMALQRPSRFIEELDEGLYEPWQLYAAETDAVAAQALSFQDPVYLPLEEPA